MSDRFHATDDGFTLVEMIIVVVMIAVLATVLATVATVILRTTGPTSDRADDSRTLHGLNTWLAQDASATAPGDFAIPGTLTECAGSTPGTSLVKMIWVEDTGTATTFVTNYRHVNQGGTYRIDRYTCSGVGAGPYANTQILRLTSELSATAPTVTPVLDTSPTPQVIGVEFDVLTAIGESVFADGGSRNPSETLPPTTTSTTTSTTTTSTTSTTSTTTTTVVSSACDLVGSPTTEIAIAPNPVTNASGGGPQELTTAVSVTIQTINTSNCSNLRLHYNRGQGGNQQEAFLSTGPNTWQVILEATNAQRWSDGSHPLDVFSGVRLNEGSYALQVN